MIPWHNDLTLTETDVRTKVSNLVLQHSATLVDAYIAALDNGDESAVPSDRQAVDQQLRLPIQAWVAALFDPARTSDELHAIQRTTGEMHARMGIPMSAVARGARHLKRALCLQLEVAGDLGPNVTAAVRYAHEVLDLALELFGTAYIRHDSRQTRAEDAYRQSYLGQNLQAERERQRAMLLAWCQSLLLGQVVVEPKPLGSGASSLAQSQFGMWLLHKAGVVFAGAPEPAWITVRARDLEERLLPELHAARGNVQRTRELASEFDAAVDSMQQMLMALFDPFVGESAARDSVTRLLHRRYLPTLIRQEIAAHRHSGAPFALVILDVDQIGQIASSLGSESTDAVLSQMATLLVDGVRAGDSVFRLGDRRFAILLVETSRGLAESIAQSLKQQIEAMTFRTATISRVQVTARMGLALFDGHPDYQRLIQRAEEGVEQATWVESASRPHPD